MTLRAGAFFDNCQLPDSAWWGYACHELVWQTATNMVTILAVANLKGGGGKTTIAVNLASALAGRAAVTVVDADAQGTATAYAAQGELPVPVLSLPLDAEQAAGRWINRVLGIDADLVIIDCPPHVGAATESAVAIADLVLIPVIPSAADLMATTAALELVRRATEARKDGGPQYMLVPSRVDRRTAAGREIQRALKRLGGTVAPPIGQRTAFVDAFGAGYWIGDYAPNSKAEAEIAALARVVRRALR